MLDFIKRNMKVVIITGVSVFVIAALSTALLVTNVASASGRGRDHDKEHSRERRHVRMELTEEQIAERAENARERLAQRLADGKITQEEYDEKITALENGEFPLHGRSKRGGRNKGESPADGS